MAIIKRNYAKEQRFHDYSTLEGMRVEVPATSVNLVGGAGLEHMSQPGFINPYVEDAVQRFPLGTRLTHGDRIFRYAKAGSSSLAVGKLMQMPVPLAGHIDEAINEPAAEATTIAFTPNTVTTDDIAANALQDGYIYINDDTGEGYMYRIRSHPALTGGASGVITLVDPIVVLPGASATATVLFPMWRNVILHPSPPTALVAGVTVAAVTGSNFCWLQVKGPCPVLIEGTVVIGQEVRASEGVDGAVTPLDYDEATQADFGEVGRVIAVNADTEYGGIWLNLPY